jgi:hypothetical protein
MPVVIPYQIQNTVISDPLDGEKIMKEHIQNANKNFQDALNYFRDYQKTQNQIIEDLHNKIRQKEQEYSAYKQKVDDENIKWGQRIKILQDDRTKIQNEKKELMQQFEQYKREKESQIKLLIDGGKNFQKINNVLEQERNTLLKERDKLRQENYIFQQKQNIPTVMKRDDAKLKVESIVDNPNTISEFNGWASNPTNQLPSSFKYISGEIKVRSEQPLAESFSKTRWITNRNGGKKFLFPNPQFFDEMTEIRELYTITGTLKSKGQNKIRITKPCEIGDKGYINYPGELQVI